MLFLPRRAITSDESFTSFASSVCAGAVKVSLSSGATTIDIPPGTVCVECIVNGEVVDDALYQIQGTYIDPSNGRTVDGVLVLFETEDVFVPNVSPTLRCFSSSDSSVSTQALVVFVSKSYT